MKDLIKEFSMLDLLGMIFPGSVLMVLICAECGAWELIERFVEADMMAAVKPVVILFGGYVLGMLLHDIGDMAERILWRVPAFNPKVTVLIDHEMAIYKRKRSRPGKTQTPEITRRYWYQKVFGWLTDWVEKLYDGIAGWLKMNVSQRYAKWFPHSPVWYQRLTAWVKGYPGRFQSIVGVPLLFAVMSVLCLAFMFSIEWNMKITRESLYTSVGTVIAIIFLISKYAKVRWEDKHVNDKLIPYGEIVGKTDKEFSELQTQHKFKTNEKGNGSKVNLFDGFRAMARNLLVGIFLTYIWAHFKQGKFYDLFMVPAENLFPAICFYVVLFLLLVHYWRYAYLQYKYIYEDIRYLEDQAEKEKAGKEAKEVKK